MATIGMILVMLLSLLFGMGAKSGGQLSVTSAGPPNQLGVRPPSGLSSSQKATFLAGEAVAAQSGCEGCHVIGSNGNDGPGPALTHIGSVLRRQAISAALRDPAAPMPSFSGLAKASPKRFRALVQFLTMLR